jgi:hypothetical protein
MPHEKPCDKHIQPRDDDMQMMSFFDLINLHMMMVLRNITEFITQLLYIFRVSPVKAYNELRMEYCEAFPEYGTREFLDMANNHPLRVVYCSHWFSKGVKFFEEIFLAPYVLYKTMSDELTAMLFPQPEPVEKPIPVDFVPKKPQPMPVKPVEVVPTVVAEVAQPIQPVETVEIIEDVEEIMDI